MSKKRPNGDGSVYWVESKQRWEATLWLGWKSNGNPDRKYFSGPTEANVLKKLNEAKRLQSEGRPVKVERQTVAQFLTAWLRDVVKLTTKPKTHEQYAWAAENHLVPGLGRYQVADLGPQDFQRFINEKVEAGLAPKSVKALRDVMRVALNQAMAYDLVQRNVAELARLPRQTTGPKRVWSVAEATRFLTAASGHRLECLFRLALCFGVRQGEILGLKWDAVDFERGSFYVRTTQQRVDGEVIHVDPKTASSRRAVPLIFGLRELFGARKTAQDGERTWAAGDWEETDLVFTSQRGTGIDVSNLKRVYKALVTKAKVEYIPFHRMRATAASLLKEHGVTDQELQVILGHSNERTTQQYYLHPTPDSVARIEAAQKAVFPPVAVALKPSSLSTGKTRAS